MSAYLESLRAGQPHGAALIEAARRYVEPDAPKPGTKRAAKYNSRAMLAFSAGKDGVALALHLQRHFDEVVPYFFYLVPDLPMDLEALDYYERHLFHRPIIRLPSPSLMLWLRGFVWQTPRSAAVIAAADLPALSSDDLTAAIRAREGLHPDCYIADGSRAGENAKRALTIRLSGPIRHNTRRWWPIWDWTKDDVLDAIEGAGLALPDVYDWQASSICGLDYEQMAKLKTHRPKDFARVVETFPLIKSEFWRFERQADKANLKSGGRNPAP